MESRRRSRQTQLYCECQSDDNGLWKVGGFCNSTVSIQGLAHVTNATSKGYLRYELRVQARVISLYAGQWGFGGGGGTCGQKCKWAQWYSDSSNVVWVVCFGSIPCAVGWESQDYHTLFSFILLASTSQHPPPHPQHCTPPLVLQPSIDGASPADVWVRRWQRNREGGSMVDAWPPLALPRLSPTSSLSQSPLVLRSLQLCFLLWRTGQRQSQIGACQYIIDICCILSNCVIISWGVFFLYCELLYTILLSKTILKSK